MRTRPDLHARVLTNALIVAHSLPDAAPSEPGRYLLKATAVTEKGARTVSRRKLTIGEP